MPATSDDDIFKRMFANFVRKRHANAPTTSAAAAAAASSSQHHHQQQYAQQHGYNNGRASSATPVDRAPDALRKVATDYNGRGFVPAPLAPELHTARHTQHHSSHAPPALHRQPSRHADSRPSAFTSLLGGRSAQPDAQRGAALGDTINPSSSRKHSTASKPGTKGSKGSRGSKGSKGSDKPVSASTEDAPPRKRTRTHPHPALQRSQSAHASLHSSRNAKSEKMRNNSRFNLPPAHAPAPAGPSNVPPSTNPNKAIKSFPCDQCPAVFAQKGQLSRHTRRVHEKLRPHACEHCGKLFGARSDRTRHIMVCFLLAIFFFSRFSMLRFSFFVLGWSDFKKLTRDDFLLIFVYWCIVDCAQKSASISM